MERRRFVLATVAGLAAPRVALAQRAKRIWRIGYLSSAAPSADKDWLAAFRLGLRNLGYVDRDFVIEPLHASGQFNLLPELAGDLVRREVDVIVVYGTPAIRAAGRATSTIPIVMTLSADPVGTKTVASLARPGANVTGLAGFNDQLGPKRLELLKAAVPSLSRVAVLCNPANPATSIQLKHLDAPASQLGLTLIAMEVKSVDQLEGALAAIARQRPEGLLIVGDPFISTHRSRIAEFAVRYRLPTIGTGRHYLDAGFLMSYGTDVADLYRRAAIYVDKVLKGAKPGELPIEQPTKFELALNLKTAKALGIAVPQALVLRADQVIE